jgi:tetratricopeptide (TPR) repeat protein
MGVVRCFVMGALVGSLGGCAATRHDGEPGRPPPATPAGPASHEEGHQHHQASATAGAFASLESLARGAQILPDLGTLHYPVKTTSGEAQAYFDQGLRLAYGFNHDEAARSFARAVALDPACAMCYWGVALTLGPNYNVPLLPDRTRTMWLALERSQVHAARGGPVERALIAALARRYKGPEPIEVAAQQPYNVAYARAMREVAGRFPDDMDVLVLTAEALMDTNPWNLWSTDGRPAPGTTEIVTLLERVLARAPEHPGANHFYIHAIEASPNPGKALPSAQRLARLMPGAGHIVHMPAHIYQRLGRYAEASDHNRRAAEVDLRYLARTTPPGYYPMYVGHNYGFLAYSASMEGRARESIAASRRSAEAVPETLVCNMPGFDFFAAEPLLVLVRFGRWHALLEEPRPPAKYQIQTGLWLQAHGMALASLGRTPEARADLAALTRLVPRVPKDLMANLNPAPHVLEVAVEVLAARIAEKEGQWAEAISRYREAVALEDKLNYAEPADWFYPTRHFLGAALLDARRPVDAEAVYRKDLAKHPSNGWALFGLWQSLAAQNRQAEARAAEAAFRAAWARADIPLTRSAFLDEPAVSQLNPR